MSNSKLKKIIIFGSSETAALAKYYFENDSKYKVIAFTVDDDFVDSEKFCGLPLLPFSNVLKNYSPSEYAMHVALSYSKLNQLRQKKYEQAFEYMEIANKERNKLVTNKPLRYEEFFLNKNKEIFSNFNFRENTNMKFYEKKLVLS